MPELIETGRAWFMNMGAKYSVNPIVFGSIYLGAIPFFTASVAWLIRNYRENKSVVLPSLCTVLFFISSYLYLIIEGENIPWWIYTVLAATVSYGAWSVYRKVCASVCHGTSGKE